MAEQNPAYAIDGSTHPAKLFRQTLGQLLSEGVGSFNGTNDLKVTQDTGANLKVKVAKGYRVVQGDDAADQGLYGALNDADVLLNVPAADVTNPRIDIVVALQNDVAYGDGDSLWSLVYIAGTPGATPAAPALPGTALLLAQVAVAANATAVTNAMITDKRVLANKAGTAVSVKYTRALDQSISDTVLSVVNWTLLVKDPFGFHSGTPEKFIVPPGYAGDFGAQSSVEWESATAGIRRIEIWKTPAGGAAARASRVIVPPPPSFNMPMPPVFWGGHLNDGDALEARVYQNTGVSRNILADEAQSWFYMWRIGS